VDQRPATISSDMNAMLRDEGEGARFGQAGARAMLAFIEIRTGNSRRRRASRARGGEARPTMPRTTRVAYVREVTQVWMIAD